ncbi:MAG: PAS domain S-box protein, partial [Pseudomonadota bacterium]|nr:PAS domain S-box protein [Pseudomonadota bacterium]
MTGWNATAERMFGTDRCRVGQSIKVFDAAVEGDVDLHSEEIAAALRHGRAPCNRMHVGVGALCFWGDGVINPMHDGEGVHLGFVKIIRDISERRQVEDAVFRAAHSDSLTDLGNRAAFDARLKEWLETGKRNDQSVVVHLL